jgi:cation diffusion facilitator family transporter
MPHTDSKSSALQQSHAVKQRVTLVCAALNLVLSVIKVVIGTIGHSQALIADGIHSLSDLASDAMVLVAIKFGSREADADHPYGHARFETVATIALGVLLLLVAIGIGLDAADRIANPASLLTPGYLALGGAIVSIVTKEWMYWYNIRVAKQLNSSLMRANAWHHRSDAISSVIVLVGIGGTMLGLPWLDAVSAIGVALMIGKIGWDLGWGGVRDLVDTGVGTDDLQHIREIIETVDGVQAFHKLRTRRMGDGILIEAHVLVGNQVTVSEGHMISDRVRARLLAEHDEVSDVLIHIDPEDDTSQRPSSNLPGRGEVLKTLNSAWESVATADRVERVNLHYLEGKIDIEVFLPLNVAENAVAAKEIATRFADAAAACDPIGKVDIYFH